RRESQSCRAPLLPVPPPRLNPAAWPQAKSRLSRSQGCGGYQRWSQPTLARQSAEAAQSIRSSRVCGSGSPERQRDHELSALLRPARPGQLCHAVHLLPAPASPAAHTLGSSLPATPGGPPSRIWRTTGEHHGGHGEVSAPASCELRDTRRRHSLPSLSDRGPLEVCSAQPAHPAVNSGPRSPKPPRCPVVCPVPSPGPLRTDLHSHSSLAQRSDFLELDCQLTRDGVVVVSHDKNLSRQSGVNRDVSSLDFEELPLYKEELEVYFSPGRFAHGSDRHMVSLEDVFQRFPRMPMSVEIKEENEELINKIAGLVRHFDRNEITVWATEKSSVMKKCRAANPEMPFSFTIGRAIWLLLLYYLGLLPFASIPERFFFCFLPTIINRTYFPFSCSGLNQLAAVISKWLIMRKSLIHHLEQRGVQVRLDLHALSKWVIHSVGLAQRSSEQLCYRLTGSPGQVTFGVSVS
uniref:GP-PDE domain-containing protein n=1 Tax=Felis catus TaxID=9685 RepID=A0ABI7ZU82_FELCA